MKLSRKAIEQSKTLKPRPPEERPEPPRRERDHLVMMMVTVAAETMTDVHPETVIEVAAAMMTAKAADVVILNLNI